MNETFKHVSIFLIFLFSCIYLNLLGRLLSDNFRFDFGDTILMLCQSTAVVILFHVLYHYFGKWPEKVSYICAGAIIALTISLVKFDVLSLS